MFLLIFLVIGGLFFLYLQRNFERKEIEARNSKLEYQHIRSIEQFTSSVDKFAGLVSGMRSYMNLSPELPTAEQFQQFVRNQYTDLQLKDSIVVSFIDTSHIFRQSFTRNAMDPANLVGQSVSTLRSKEKIKRLDNLMTHDSLRMFPPINLVEGWVGLPIDFRVHRKGQTVGYVAPILSFKTILDAIYEDDRNNEFVFHFTTKDGLDFDRTRAYDSTTTYTAIKDSEYYKNFDIDPGQYLYTTKTYFGFDVTIGTAYKEPFEGNKNFTSLLSFWYISIVFLATIVTWQVNRFRKVNSKLVKNNKLLLRNRKEIKIKNDQLQKLNNTQKKFFSIIGHDIKQPLNAIEGLLSLLEHEEIKDPDLAEIIKSLNKSTKNTTNLLNNLLRWARSQTGDIKFEPVPLDLIRLLENVTDTLHYQAKEKNIQIIRHSGSELAYEGDRDMLRTIFRNLISNAIKFTNPGGTIEIKTEINKSVIAVEVKDNGIGMTAEEVDSLFILDKQISTVGTSGEMGTGLGLILCKDFTEMHGGRIEVESEPEQGTIFKLLFPL